VGTSISSSTGGKVKSSTVICALALCVGLACAGQKPDPWLTILKSKDGFLFQGHLERTKFSFDIPGDEIKVAEQEDPGDPARMSIDSIFFAVMPVRKSEFPSSSSDILISYRKSEQQYEKKNFGRVVLSDLDVCKGASLKHESWQLKTLDLKAPEQAYMVVKAGNYVIVISSAFANAEEKQEMLSKFSGFCKSFKVGKAR
jgi:hypothetical protein